MLAQAGGARRLSGRYGEGSASSSSSAVSAAAATMAIAIVQMMMVLLVVVRVVEVRVVWRRNCTDDGDARTGAADADLPRGHCRQGRPMHAVHAAAGGSGHLP